MPHFILEYSTNLEEHHNIDVLMERVHAAAQNHPAVAVDGIRSRAVPRDKFRVADCDPRNAFLGIIIRVGPGRTDDEKRSMVSTLLDAAQHQLESESSEFDIMYSSELQEIDAEFRENRNQVRARMNAAQTPASAGASR